MQFVCEDRLHKSQVGAVGSSLGSYPRGRQFESGTLQHSFLGDKKIGFISYYYRKAYYSWEWYAFKRFYGVTVAQEILVLLEIVRFSLELHIYWIKSIFFIYVLLLVKVVVLYLLYTFLSVSFT